MVMEGKLRLIGCMCQLYRFCRLRMPLTVIPAPRLLFWPFRFRNERYPHENWLSAVGDQHSADSRKPIAASENVNDGSQISRRVRMGAVRRDGRCPRR